MSKTLSLMKLWVLVGMVSMPALAIACSTPVFEYALQRWVPDSYGIHISRAAEPDAEEMSAIALLQGNTAKDGSGANIDISVSIATNAPSTITVRYPRMTRIKTPVWQAPLTLANAKKVLDSPVRQLIFKEIASGQTAVWLLLESGNRALDDAAEHRLRAMLREMEETLVLPESESTDDDEASVPTQDARKASFAILRVSRTDQAEALLVSSLLNSESDLQELKEPMVFPVFGRGRMLYAVVGKGINADVVSRYGVFITGSCACEVKAENPGMDLLLNANWNDVEVKFPHEDTPLPPLTGIAVDPVAEAAPVVRDEAPSPEAKGSVARNTIIALACLAGLVFAGSLAVFFRARGSR